MAVEWRQGAGKFFTDMDLNVEGRLVAWVRPENGRYLLLSAHDVDELQFPTLEAAKLAAELMHA